MDYLLALDQGTTSSRAVVFDGRGRPLEMVQIPLESHYPRDGWVEQNPFEIWTTQQEAARKVLERSGVAAGDLSAVGITNQRETTVVWDRRTGEAVHDAIVWQDRRTAERCRRLREEGLEPEIREKTGLLLDPYFSGTKLQWILEHNDEARGLARDGDLAFGTVDAWLLWNLTGGEVHATDATNASRTLLYNIREDGWDDELCDRFDVPPSVLPEVRDSSGFYGELDPNVLGASVPVTGVAGDQQSALFGQACTRPGMAKNTYGTGCFLLTYTGEEAPVSEHRLLTTLAARLDGRTVYALEGSVFTAGAAVEWLKNGLGIIDEVHEVEELARRCGGTDGTHLVPAFTGLGAPDWEPDARGTLVGLTRDTTDAQIARATLEGIAHQSADVLEAMASDVSSDLSELRVDGGAARNDLLLQVQADVLDVPVMRPDSVETTARGAALLAGLAMDVWSDPEALRDDYHVDRRFEPRMDESVRREHRRGWKRALDAALHWARQDES